jgi:predicted double-glycine peptidase
MTRLIQLSILLMVSLILCSCNMSTSEKYPTMTMLGQTNLRKYMQSWKELHERHVVMQKYDYSCGAAALATLIQYYFQDNVNEGNILASILENLSEEDFVDRTENGLSLLDLKQCAGKMGYQAVGVRLKYANLSQLKGPILIHIERDGYKHFAVFRGLHGDRIYLADPSRGEIRMSVYRFSEEWTGIALVLGKSNFGLPDNYPLTLGEADIAPDEALLARRALYIAK